MKSNILTFENDVLKRKVFCENLKSKIISQYPLSNESYTVGINGKYGTGKTWILKMWEEDLRKEYKVSYLDIWKDEFFNNPLISFCSSILDLFPEDKTKKKLNTLCRYAIGTIKESINTNFGIMIKKESAKSDDFFKDYKGFKDVISEVRIHLKSEIEKNKSPLFILVDELDRVKPSYALDVLEIVKHFFNIPGMVFIFAVNRDQLEVSIKHHYGSEMNFEGYYKRFFKTEIDIPTINYMEFAKHLYQIKEKTKPQNFQCYQDRIIVMAKLMESFDISLREAEYSYDTRSYLLGKPIENNLWKWCFIDISTLACILYLKKRELFNEMYNLLKVASSNNQNSEDCLKKIIKKLSDFKHHKSMVHVASIFLNSILTGTIPYNQKLNLLSQSFSITEDEAIKFIEEDYSHDCPSIHECFDIFNHVKNATQLS